MILYSLGINKAKKQSQQGLITVTLLLGLHHTMFVGFPATPVISHLILQWSAYQNNSTNRIRSWGEIKYVCLSYLNFPQALTWKAVFFNDYVPITLIVTAYASLLVVYTRSTTAGDGTLARIVRVCASLQHRTHTNHTVTCTAGMYCRPFQHYALFSVAHIVGRFGLSVAIEIIHQLKTSRQ